MSKNATVTVTKNKGAIEVSAAIPALRPRKGIEPIRYDLTDAHAAAVAEFGADRVGSLISPSIVLENRPRTNVLEGRWIFEYVTLEVPVRRPTTRRPRSTRTKTKTTE
jgi:hypothetical protein